MREKIHPTYYPDARVICACGNSWMTGSTVKEIRTDVCHVCHPFFTGEQRIVDSAGQVDRFMKRLEAKSQRMASEQLQREAREAQKRATKRARARGDDPEAAPKRATAGSSSEE